MFEYILSPPNVFACTGQETRRKAVKHGCDEHVDNCKAIPRAGTLVRHSIVKHTDWVVSPETYKGQINIIHNITPTRVDIDIDIDTFCSNTKNVQNHGHTS